MTRSSAVSIAHAMPSAAQLPALAAVAAAARGLSAGLAKRPSSGDAACGSDILASRQRTARTSRTRDLTNEPDFQPHDTSEPQRRDAEPSDATLGAAEASVHAPLEAGSDEALLVAHREGAPDALRQLIDRYRNDLHGFLTRLVGSRTGADDVFQEAFLQVHLSSESFDRARRFRPWLYTIAANKGRDYLRRQKRRSAASLDAPLSRDGEGSLVDLLEGAENLPALPLEAADERNLVKQVVEEMPHHFREILLLSYFQRLSYAQISESLSIPLGTVKSRLHAAVASFASSFRLACERRGLPLPDERGESERNTNDRGDR
jgi:RNA polymerase sigma-70 factor (ECF subfamily)